MVEEALEQEHELLCASIRNLEDKLRKIDQPPRGRTDTTPARDARGALRIMAHGMR
eukprot:gene35372-32596_t